MNPFDGIMVDLNQEEFLFRIEYPQACPRGNGPVGVTVLDEALQVDIVELPQ